jgi:hypothetical protein
MLMKRQANPHCSADVIGNWKLKSATKAIDCLKYR